MLPDAIVEAAWAGSVSEVRAWLDADPAHDVNDTDGGGAGLLRHACGCFDVTRGTALMAFLLARGADVNQRRGGDGSTYAETRAATAAPPARRRNFVDSFYSSCSRCVEVRESDYACAER